MNIHNYYDALMNLYETKTPAPEWSFGVHAEQPGVRFVGSFLNHRRDSITFRTSILNKFTLFDIRSLRKDESNKVFITLRH